MTLIKAGVDLRGLTAQMAVAYTMASTVFFLVAASVCTITSGSDGTHGPNSLHYRGKALDLRTNHLKPEHVQPVYTALKEALGAQFDVVLEADHLHVEFDPKETDKPEDL